MRARIIGLSVVVAILLSLAVALAPVKLASAAEPLTANFTGTVTNPGEYRPFNLGTGDEIIQFIRSTHILSAPQTAGLTTLTTMVGTVTGGLTGDVTLQGNSVSLPVVLTLGSDGFGYAIGTWEFIGTGPFAGSTLKGITVTDYDYYNVAPMVSNALHVGYMFSTEETGVFAGEKVIGTVSMVTEDLILTATAQLKRYSAIEISRLDDTESSVTATVGSIPNISTMLQDDQLVEFTDPLNNYTLPADAGTYTYYQEASTFSPVYVSTGPLAGATLSYSSDNAVYYGGPSGCFGWSVMKWAISRGGDTVRGIHIIDLGDCINMSGYTIAFSDDITGVFAGKDLYGIYTMTQLVPGSYTGTVSGYQLVPVTDSVEELTSPGEYTVDATAEANTVVIKTGTGTPTVTVAKFSTNPGTKSFAGDIGKYIDVYVPDITDVDQIEIRLSYTDSDIAGLSETSLRMRYWDGSDWSVCSDTGVNEADNYIWAKIRSDTTPNLAYLTGQQFGGGGDPFGSGATGVPVFPTWYIGIAAALVAGVLAYLYRRRVLGRKTEEIQAE